MRRLVFVFFAWYLSTTPFAIAAETQYYDCILRHLGEAKIDLTVELMKEACNENYRGPSLSQDRRRSYNECLLEHLARVENPSAAAEIQYACSQRHL